MRKTRRLLHHLLATRLLKSNRRVFSFFSFRFIVLTAFILAPQIAIAFLPVNSVKVSAQNQSGPKTISDSARRQIQALVQENQLRTPAQQKMDSQILDTIKMFNHQSIAPGVNTLRTNVEVDAKEMIVVQITVRNAKPVLDLLRRLGATVMNTYEHKIRARIHLNSIEPLAGSPEVIYVAYPSKPQTQSLSTSDSVISQYKRAAKNEELLKGGITFESTADRIRHKLMSALSSRQKRGKQAQSRLAINTSEGDVTHCANIFRTPGFDGSGIKIGVLSDGVDSLAALQSSGDLPLNVTVLHGGTGNEGCAMLEIIYDLAPGAQLFFATGFTSIQDFAQNIRELAAAGCDIIVDDIGYPAESPLQDGQTLSVLSPNDCGIVTQAVNDVTANGVLYFSSAGNDGNEDDGTSSTWEGEFVDGGLAGFPIDLIAPNVRLHDFGGQTFNVVSNQATITLHWADPLGRSDNNYDLFILDPTGTSVTARSNNAQNGQADPFESCEAFADERICITAICPPDGGGGNGQPFLPNSGEPICRNQPNPVRRFLSLRANRGGTLQISTEGSIYGHPMAADAFAVAATPAAQAQIPGGPSGPFPNPFNPSNVSELFSSDGPRKIFFAANGSPNQTVRQKPDITAADGVMCAAPGFNPFFGTSAAAPHAAAIAALLKSANPDLTPAQIRSLLTSTAIDIEQAGVDRNTGAGIITLCNVPNIIPDGSTLTTESCPPSNNAIDPNETVTVSFCFLNVGADASDGAVIATLEATGGVISPSGPQNYGELQAGGPPVCRTFTFQAQGACGSFITATFNLMDQLGSLGTRKFNLRLGTPSGLCCPDSGTCPMFTVSNTNNSGPCSLRQAIIDANATTGGVTITFAIPGSGVQTINLASPLPVIITPMTIDGTTQAGFAGSPLIELNVAGAGVADGLIITAGNTTVRGLIINRYQNASGAPTCRGISLYTRGGNIIEGNYIGTNAAGTAALAESDFGILISNSSNNRIGGLTTAARNVICRGVHIDQSGSTGNVVEGNYMGVNTTGTASLGGGGFGVAIDHGASNNVVGGTTPAARNIISGNTFGVGILRNANSNVVTGNYIGINAAGTAAVRNLFHGVQIRFDANNNTIGGNTASERNIISGNGGDGVNIDNNGNSTGNLTSGNLIRGNFIGADPTGTTAIGNGGNGVNISFGASGNFIGGFADSSGGGNVIAFNGGRGIVVESGTGNFLIGNSIFSNTLLGIDLGANGVTANDNCDADTGANNLQNFPVLTSATSSGNTTTITGTLNSTTGALFRLEFFANPTCNIAGNGDGRTYIGFIGAMPNSNCTASFTATFPIAIPLGQFITATATSVSGSVDTSEFSPCVQVMTPTAVSLMNFQAMVYDGGTFFEWQTGYEVSNLGFRIYRDDDKGRTLINPQLIAGSALRSATALTSGEAYAWWDSSINQAATYWLEDLDLSGRATLHGPFQVKFVGGSPPERSQASLLRGIGSTTSSNSSRPFEPTAAATQLGSQQSRILAALASRSAVKIAVRHEGWYRLTQAQLIAAGLSKEADPRFLRLFADGTEVPMIVSTSKDGVVDAIEFYGLGIDTPSTDTHIYWLIADTQQGKRIAVSKGEGISSSSTSFTQSVELKDRHIYFAALRNGDTENFFGAVVGSQAVDQQLTVRHPDQKTTNDAALEVTLQGVTETAHRVMVQFNGITVGAVEFDNQKQGAGKFIVPHYFVREGANTVSLIAQNGDADVSLVDVIRLRYQHTFTADDDVLQCTTNNRERVRLDGFSSSAIRVFDVTDANAPTELYGEISQQTTGYAITVTAAQNGERRLLALTNQQIASPESISSNRSSNWRDASHAADYVIITNRDFLSAIESLRAVRQAQGYQVAVIDVEDLYDECNFGNKSSQAIKDFLADAKAHWQLKPRFVLFVGDASYDAKNYLGFGSNDLLPTKLLDTGYLETASDDWFADFDNDGLPEMSIGRLPVRSLEEATNAVSKILRYEQTTMPAAALLVADSNDTFDFEQASAALRPLLPPIMKVEELWRGQLSADTAKARLFAAITRGQTIVNYTGHGSLNVWNGNLLTATEARNLSNDKLPLFVMMNCLNGYFHDAAQESLGESLLKAERGGAIAVWASSGLTLPAEQALMNQEFYRRLFREHLTIGEAALKAKQAIRNRDIRATWNLLGDPTLRLK